MKPIAIFILLLLTIGSVLSIIRDGDVKKKQPKVESNYVDALTVAKDLAYYMEVPDKDSATFFVIVGDSTVQVTKYADSTLKLTLKVVK